MRHQIKYQNRHLRGFLDAKHSKTRAKVKEGKNPLKTSEFDLYC